MTRSIALYMRLSSDDGGEGESCSIANQRELLRGFVREHREFDGCSVQEFADDGYTGTNFNRPGVQRMLALAGDAVDCIIVKDFSRFGRNLVEVGDYLDQVFPFLGVRFIAVNEGYDSGKGYGSTVSLDVSLKAMIYEMYSRDISDKILSVKHEKMRRGEYLGGTAFYGYQKSESAKNRLEVDPPAAGVVRRIFNMAAEGVSATEIAKALNCDGILSPMRYYGEKYGRYQKAWKVAGDTLYWTRESVRRILKDERYTGCAVGHKRERVRVSMNKTCPVPREKWIVVEGAHEAIVSKELFGKVAEILKPQRAAKPARKPFQLFRGMLKCACCGRTLTRCMCKEPYYYCTSRRSRPDVPCAGLHLDEQELTKVVYDSIMVLAALQAEECGGAEPDAKRDQEIGRLQEAIESCKEERTRCRALQIEAFEEYAEGRMEKQQFQARKQEIAARQEEADRRLAELLERLAAVRQGKTEPDSRGSVLSADGLTREMLEAFVKEIRVDVEDRLEIVWNFAEAKELGVDTKFLCKT